MSRKRISRRKFVGDVGAGVAFTIVPRHVLGRGYRAPSDKLNVACIGVGGMGRNDVRRMEGENIYALCDVDWKSAEDAFQTYIKAKRYRDYREMFDKESKNIDAVTVSTPDHSHAAAGMLAMKAGKHTYIQKPLARTMGEVRALGDMACHIMDAAYWTLDLGYPTRIEAESTPLFRETAPAGSRISYSFAAKGKRPEVKVVWRDGSLYPPRPAEVADELAWPFDKGGGQLWIGSDGKLTAGTYGDDAKLLTPTKQGVASGDPPPPPPPAQPPKDPP